jgi:hypothetical protein
MLRYFSFIVCLLLAAACSPRLVTKQFPLTTLSTAPQTVSSRNASEAPEPITYSSSYGDGWEHYVPDLNRPEDTPMRYIRVNFHIMDNKAGNAHLPPDSVRYRIRELLRYANADLDTNVRNWRSPEGTPVLPKRLRYVLTPQSKPGDDGIYFHYEDNNDLVYYIATGRDANNYSMTIINKYAIGMDSILNIFVQKHHPDSCNSKTYNPRAHGIALGQALKLSGLLELTEKPPTYRGLLNHEVGHIFYLSHAWMEDGCPDTPNHPNRCWVWTPDGFCRDNATNNMMDYNADQIAMTPCQIARIHAVLSSERDPLRRCVMPTWCSYRASKSIVVRDSVSWAGDKDLDGDLTVAAGGTLRLAGRLSMPPGGRIIVEPGAALWLDGCRLHNACGKPWRGVFVQQLGKQRGVVRLGKAIKVENEVAVE